MSSLNAPQSDAPNARNAASTPAVEPINALADTQAAPAASSVPEEPFPIQDWEHYEFVRVLGQGGMGTVYEAIDKRLHRKVALKFLRDDNEESTARFMREARAQARIDHENICKVFEVGEVEGRAYIAMQFVSGETLDKAAVFMTVDEKVIVMRDVAQALHVAHTLGILHRDIKPANILVETTSDGRHKPVVMDFGLAREESENRGMTQSGMILGTPAYMSPEQAQGSRSIDRRTDVYSLGATLYEVLSGRAPFVGDNLMHIMMGVLSEEPTSLRQLVPTIPADLITITNKCLHKDPGERYESARGLAEDLERHLRGESIVGRRESVYRQFRRWARQHRAIVVMAIVSLLIAGVAGGLAISSRVQANREKEEVQALAAVEREIGQILEEIEWLMRTAYILPEHDVSAERNMVRERMKELEGYRAKGAHIEKLVDYALGRGHLALGEDEEAYKLLLQAKKKGIDSPELHYALGLVLGRRYDGALRQMQESDEMDAEQLRVLYLRPTLEAMEKSRGAHFKSQNYMNGLLAYYKKDYDAALVYAQKALKEAPWLYEAIELEAGVYFVRGIEEANRGDFVEAEQSLSEASRKFDRAAQYGRSDARLHEASAQALRWRLKVAAGGEAGLEALIKQIEARAKTALVIDPARMGPYFVLIGLLERERTTLANKFLDPRPVIQAQIEIGKKALANIGKKPALCNRIDVIYSKLTEYQIEHGIDPEESITKEIEMCECAMATDPSAKELGFIGASLREEDDTKYRLGQYLDAYLSRAMWMVLHGKDPEPALRTAMEHATEQLRMFPQDARTLRFSGLFQTLIARYRLQQGQDPGPFLTEANRHFDKAWTTSQLQPIMSAWLEMLELQVLAAFIRKEGQESALDELKKNVEICALKLGNFEKCGIGKMVTDLYSSELVSGEERKLRLIEVSKRAEELVEQRESMKYGEATIVDIYELWAEATHRLAVADPRGARKYIATGVHACERGMAINAQQPRLHFLLGQLRLLEAQGATGKAREEAVQRALAAFEKAQTINPQFARHVKPLLAQAKELGGNRAVQPL